MGSRSSARICWPRSSERTKRGSSRSKENSFLFGREHPLPIGRRSLDLELGDTVPVEIVGGGEEAGRSEPEVVEQAQRRCPVLPSVSSQQRGVLVNKLVLDNPLRRQRIDTARLSLALNRYEIHLDQSRIAEASSCLLADHQIDAIDLAGPPAAKRHSPDRRAASNRSA